jgi:hypothetical protein
MIPASGPVIYERSGRVPENQKTFKESRELRCKDNGPAALETLKLIQSLTAQPKAPASIKAGSSGWAVNKKTLGRDEVITSRRFGIRMIAPAIKVPRRRKR